MDNNELTIENLLPDVLHSKQFGKTFVGIDFGTSTCVVSIANFNAEKKEVVVTPIRIGQQKIDGSYCETELVPSVIAYYNGGIYFGQGAEELKYHNKKDEDIWYAFKMELGENLGDRYYNSKLNRDEIPEQFWIKQPKDCAKLFFLFLKQKIKNYCLEHNLSQNICYSISIPASFEANQRQDLIEALSYNDMDITDQALIDEPNAAFISYVFESTLTNKPIRISPHYNSKVMVFDYGGGTCDVSILEIGLNHKGFYSKNIALSNFSAIGGYDVDRYIAIHYLLPRLLERNNKNIDDFTISDKKYIWSQLLKIAERLKILISKQVASHQYDFVIEQYYTDSDQKIEIHYDLIISTTQGDLIQNDFFITYKEFADCMAIFVKRDNYNNIDLSRFYNSKIYKTTFAYEDDYNSIFTPIENVLAKAKFTAEDIDYVLLIGGSSQNPYLQRALRKYFSSSKFLVPRDLQMHVSQGTAINSFIVNGLNIRVIASITSENIFIITKDDDIKILFPAGTELPTNTVTIEDLVTSKTNQKIIELPICVGNRNKMLFNIKMDLDNDVPINTPIKIVCSINADKLLRLQATCMGKKVVADPINPLSNKELTYEQKQVLLAERDANNERAKTGSLSNNGYRNLVNAYKKADQDLLAAQTYEQQYNSYPKSCSLNTLGVYYSICGQKKKAIEFYKKALEQEPNDDTINSNLGYIYYCIGDSQEAVKYLKRATELNPKHAVSWSMFADVEMELGHKEIAKEYRERSFEIFDNKRKTGYLTDCEYGWFISLAREMGKSELVTQLKNECDKKHKFNYNEDNLAKAETKTLAFKQQKLIE